MRRLEIEARAHDDVEPCAPADPLQRRGIAPNAEIRRIDDRPAAIFDETRELLDRDLDVEKTAVVAVEKGIHPEVAEHRDVDGPLGEADFGGAARPFPPARCVE